jgi:biopolymer transport protein ExbD
MRVLLALSVVACSSSAPTPQPKLEPVAGSAATTTSAATLTPGVELSEVALSGFDTADNVEPTVSITLSSLTVSGKLVVSLQDGVVPPEELEGGALGMTIEKLGAIAGKLDTSKRIVIAIDKRIPYRTMIATLYTLKQAKHNQFGLLARAGAHVVLAPITLPDKRDATASSGGKHPGGGLDAQINEVKNANPQSILHVIQTKYVAGIKRCYKDHLKRDPSAKGKLALTFTVDGAGKTKQAKATGIALTLESCVKKQMVSWRFAASADPDGETFAMNVMLIPDGEPAPQTPTTPTAAPLPTPAAPPLQLIVSVTKTDAILWSISGLEGTLQTPKLAVKLAEKSALTDLTRALAEIVARRFASAGERDDRGIIIQADNSAPMQMIAELIGAVRATPDAKELFPDVQFATSFE